MVKYALITGASSGIGEEFAKQLSRKGKSLILVARSQKKLEKLALTLHELQGINVITIPLDLSQPDAAEQLFEYCKANRFKIDFLINNAGMGLIEDVSEYDLDKIDEMSVLNMVTVTKLSQLFLPELIKHNGILLNVASQAAFQPQPRMALFAATKSYVLNFTESLRVENEEKKIRIFTLCPGPTYTDFFRNSLSMTDKIDFRFHTTIEVVERKFPLFSGPVFYNHLMLNIFFVFFC